MEKIKMEIWSDVFCPYCYIGKTNLEAAIEELGVSDKIELEWKSYQLKPGYKQVPGETANQSLAKHLRITPERARELNQQVSASAAQSGLNFNTDIMVWADSFDAHRLIHFAATKGLSSALKGSFFKAVFEEGKNLNNSDDLVLIAKSIGLEAEEVVQVLHSDQFSREVRKDIEEAQVFGIQGVPTFVVNREYAFSGAQPKNNFKQVLSQLLAES